MKIIKFILVFILAMSLSGCLEPRTPEQIISLSPYPSLTKEIINNVTRQNGFYNNYFSNYIEISHTLRGDASFGFTVDEVIFHHLKEYDLSSDLVFQAYVKNAKNNKNIIKTYKFLLAKDLAKIMPLPRITNKNSYKFDLDNVFIEFDKNNKIISALMKVHVIFHGSQGKTHYLYSMIYFGMLATKIENNISNRALENAYLRDYKFLEQNKM